MRIRIVSPSGAIDPQYIDNAAKVLQSWGHQVSIAPSAYNQYGRFAGTPQERIDDLNAAFIDENIDAILCSRGGYGLTQIIDKIEPTKKLVIGFSDITCLHQLLQTKQTPSLHAPMAKHISTWQQQSYSLTALRQILDGKTVAYQIPSGKLSRTGVAKGILRGGNLSVLYGLQATNYQLIADNSLLFIEDIAERHYHIDRMMQNLRLSGVMGKISGLIVGQFTDCADDPLMQTSIKQTILNATEGYSYPVLFDFPAGHSEPNLPLWLGRKHQLTVQKRKSKLELI